MTATTTAPPATEPSEPSSLPRKGCPPATDEQPDRPVTLAIVTGAHGVQGEVRLKVFADSLDAHRRFNGGALEMTGLRGGIARFAGVADRGAAEGLRGTSLTVPRSSLPPLDPGEYYHVDLLGLTAVTASGEPLGTVIAIENYGAGDVIEIKRATGKRFMVPMTRQAVPDWNHAQLTIDEAFVED